MALGPWRATDRVGAPTGLPAGGDPTAGGTLGATPPTQPALDGVVLADVARSRILRPQCGRCLPGVLQLSAGHRPGGVVTDPAGLALLDVVAGSSIGARVVLASLGDDIDPAARLGLSEGASPTSAALWRQTLSVLSGPVDASFAGPAAAACELVFRSLLALAGRLPGTRGDLRARWSPRSESNRRPIAYKAIALTTELRGRAARITARKRVHLRRLGESTSGGLPPGRLGLSR